MNSLSSGHSLATSAAKAGMDEKTARKYRKLGQLPSELETTRYWRTRKDPFAEIWPEVAEKLKVNDGLEAKTLFQDLRRRYPGRYTDGQLRTLQRKIRRWRATEGPPKEVYFPQTYAPGERSQSDFTSMRRLGVTIEGQAFDHLLYHFVLPYSNWETGSVTYSESFESLSAGFQRAVRDLGGVPKRHQTDRLSAAVARPQAPNQFTEAYQALMRHYGVEPMATQARSPHENGDVEQAHHRFKRALDQSLMLRGSRDFASVEAYERFLAKLFAQLNQGRQERFDEERRQLRQLPAKPLPSFQRLKARVAASCVITVRRNVYSVPSRLIGEQVDVRLHADRLEVFYAQQRVTELPRLRGSGRHRIDYRHVIDTLVRKPGAFARYAWKADLYPTHRFRLTFDLLMAQHAEPVATKQYLLILQLAARAGQEIVGTALGTLIGDGVQLSAAAVEEIIRSASVEEVAPDPKVRPVNLNEYDALLQREVAA